MISMQSKRARPMLCIFAIYIERGRYYDLVIFTFRFTTLHTAVSPEITGRFDWLLVRMYFWNVHIWTKVQHTAIAAIQMLGSFRLFWCFSLQRFISKIFSLDFQWRQTYPEISAKSNLNCDHQSVLFIRKRTHILKHMSTAC